MMPQRCGLCGKTEKQHKGRACFDMEGFKRILELKKALEKAKESRAAARAAGRACFDMEGFKGILELKKALEKAKEARAAARAALEKGN